MSVTYTENFIESVEDYTHKPNYAPMYGRKLLTPYLVKCKDGRIRRVYAMCYSNSASLYLVIGGMEQFLGIDDEYNLKELSEQYLSGL